ncbi:MAG: ATP-binding protein [bacterium]|nr:ATP-binding protein [bacterium]
MPPLNILIGGESFRELRERNCCYVDKTTLLEEMLTAIPPKVSLVTRPRRFGKTLTLSMLQEFFDIQKDSRGIFEGLAVSGNGALCKAWMNQYPVVFLTLKNIEGLTFQSALSQFGERIRVLLISMTYLTESPRVNASDRAILSQLEAGHGDDTMLMNSLDTLCRALEAHWGKPVILLIDEYDVPINHAEQKGYYDEMIGFMRSLLGAALKTNASLKFAVLTGCLRIARESIFTGLNNFKCYGISDVQYADKLGFTPAEVDTLLSDAGFPDKKAILKEWYDGYRFGKQTEMYCPWDILQYLYDLQIDPDVKPQAYWKNTSGNAIVRALIEQTGQKTRKKIEDLIEGKVIEENLAEDLTYNLVYENEGNIWSMLYLTGYLTRASRQPDNGNTALVIPNKEVREIFTTTVTAWFNESIGKQDLSPLVEALWNGDAAAMQDILKRILYSTISYYDSAENFYHGFMAGLVSGMGLDLESNRENGLGRSDITIEDGLNNRAIIIELKYAPEYEDLDRKAGEALAQIEERKYAAGLPPNIRTVLKYGISFWKKECCVKTACQKLTCKSGNS